MRALRARYEFSLPSSPRVAAARYVDGYVALYRALNRRRAWRWVLAAGLGLGAPQVAAAARTLREVATLSVESTTI